MIPQDTVEKILETAQVEEVLGEFITLKKRGVNYIGLCPFHNEKTPSFTVSPAKGIYKCFGCGAAGNSTKFLMEHEHYSYPEALRFLANKYNIEVEEAEQDDTYREEASFRDGLYVINEFAQQYFTENLFNHAEGKQVGLSYFKERGFNESVVQKFELGYSLSQQEAFTKAAINKGFQLELLKKLGLTTEKENDFFRERVIFPIHNLSGKVIGFGGRTLKSDKKIPKYLNSPESPIYHKSKVLYGAYFAKGPIRKEDECFLVEGYTDVISLHQGGIENVVASSGTSLTTEQIRLIRRYTKNITVLFDGDQAGVKAAFRGIELILEEGLNVKVISLPEQEDPDSYLKKIGSTDFKKFLKEQAKDFIVFKTEALIKELANKQISKSELVDDLANTLSRIKSSQNRSLYIKDSSRNIDVSEDLMSKAVNQKLRNSLSSSNTEKSRAQDGINEAISDELKDRIDDDTNYQEKDIIRILIQYGHKLIDEKTTVTEYILSELEEITFNDPTYAKIVEEIIQAFTKNGNILTNKHFVNHDDEVISNIAIELSTSPYHISENWEKMHDITISDMELIYKQDIQSGLMRFKLKKINQMIAENREQIKQVKPDEDLMTLLKINKKLEEMRGEICAILGTVVY